jgi:hypothetical protein
VAVKGEEAVGEAAYVLKGARPRGTDSESVQKCAHAGWEGAGLRFPSELVQVERQDVNRAG